MSCLPFDFSGVLDSFASPPSSGLQAWEREGSRVDSLWKWATGTIVKRDMPATTVLAINQQKSNQMGYGDMLAGGIAILTQDALYFQTDDDTSGLQNKQSFVEYAGFTYRIIGTNAMMANAGFNAYLAERFVNFEQYT